MQDQIKLKFDFSTYLIVESCNTLVYLAKKFGKINCIDCKIFVFSGGVLHGMFWYHMHSSPYYMVPM